MSISKNQQDLSKELGNGVKTLKRLQIELREDIVGLESYICLIENPVSSFGNSKSEARSKV
jgi:hypothetical protein